MALRMVVERLGEVLSHLLKTSSENLHAYSAMLLKWCKGTQAFIMSVSNNLSGFYHNEKHDEVLCEL